MKKTTLEKIRSIADEFVAWQEESGCISKEKCPYFAPEYKPFFRYMEIPFMARALYKLYGMTNEIKYKISADKYQLFYVDLIETLITSEKIAYKFGMALEASALYAKYNPADFNKMSVHSKLLHKWLRMMRTDEFGSYFLCGYKMENNTWNEPDVGFSDDLLHVGRGLVRTYETMGGSDILEDALGLAKYYLTDCKDMTMDGLWNPELGTWAIGPWPDTGFEHLDNVPACKAGWMFSAYGAAEFLLALYPYVEDQKMKNSIIEKSIISAKWIFEKCQFGDGAIGMASRDDKWVGLTALGPMLIASMYRKRMLTDGDIVYFKPRVKAAWEWLLANTGDNFPLGGYIKATGKTSLIPGDNIAWLIAWAMEGLEAEDDIEIFISCK